MNDSILAIIGFIFIVLPMLILRVVYQKLQAAKQKAQMANIHQEPSVVHKPTRAKGSVAALIVMTLMVAVWALMIGFTVGVFSHLIYIVFIFPLVMGINSGKMIVDAAQRAKIRKTSQLVFLSVLSAILIYGTFHYTRYIGFQIKASMEVFSDLDEATDGQNLQATNALLNYSLEEETGQPGFLGYILYEAKEGATIGRLTRSSGFNLGPFLTWLYWLVEFGIILGATIQKGKSVISRSFCEACGNWHGSEKHLGGTASTNESILLDLIHQKDFSSLGEMIEKNATLPSVEVYFQGCQICRKSQSQLLVRHAFQNGKGRLQFLDTAKTILQPSESVLLLSQLSFSDD